MRCLDPTFANHITPWPFRHRTKPANRAKKARSSSQESESANPKSKSPSSHPKLYPLGDGTYAPLDYILSLQTGYNNHHPDHDAPADRQSSSSAHGNNGCTDHQHYDQSAFLNHDRPDHVATILNNNNDDDGGNDFPIPTARLPSIGRRTDMQTNYGSMSSQLNPMLLPRIGSFDLGSEVVPNTHNDQQLSNGGLQMSSLIRGNSQMSTLHSGPDGTKVNEKSTYLQNLDGVMQSGPLPKQQPPEQSSSRYSSYKPFLSASQEGHPASDSELAFAPDDTAIKDDVQISRRQDPTHTRDRREDDYLIHSQDHRKKFLGASSSQVFVKWLDEESGGIKPTSHLKHGMSGAEEMILPGQLELCHHPLPPPAELETYVSMYFRTFHIIYPVLDETWLRTQLTRPKGPQTATEDFVTPVVYLVVSLGASMTASSHQSSAVSKTYLDQAWKALSVILGRPFRSSVQALILMAVAFRLVSQPDRDRWMSEVN
jgi:hypothetical protein